MEGNARLLPLMYICIQKTTYNFNANANRFLYTFFVCVCLAKYNFTDFFFISKSKWISRLFRIKLSSFQWIYFYIFIWKTEFTFLFISKSECRKSRQRIIKIICLQWAPILSPCKTAAMFFSYYFANIQHLLGLRW